MEVASNSASAAGYNREGTARSSIEVGRRVGLCMEVVAALVGAVGFVFVASSVPLPASAVP